MSSKGDFLQDLNSLPLGVVAGKWILERTPYFFERDVDRYRAWRHSLGTALEVDPLSVVVTGSAAVGFSVSPNKNLKPFLASSDVDVALVSEHYFLLAWRYLRRLGSKRLSFAPRERQSVDDHRRRLIYWGTVATDRILQRLPFGKEWVPVLERCSAESPCCGRAVNARLYRDFEALRAYQVESLRQLREHQLEEDE